MLIAITSLWLAMAGIAHAQSGGIAEARLLSKSTSSKTLLFNVGSLDKIKAGEHGVILRRVRAQDVMAIRVIPIAKARVIRTSNNRSLWHVYDIPDSTQLIMRDSYLLTTEGMAMNGRRLLENTRLKVIDEKKDMAANFASKKEGDKNLLSQRKDEYQLVKTTHKLGETYRKDGVLHDADEWVTVGKDGQQKFAQALWRSPFEGDFAVKKRIETFEKLVTIYLERINDPAFNYGDFYWQNTQTATGEYRSSTSTLNQMAAFKEKERQQMTEDEQQYREILEKGQAWSADYSDEELAGMINKVGVVYEQDRRRTLATRTYNWQLVGSMGLNMLDNENHADSQNNTKAKWNAEIGAEWFPSPRHLVAQKFSVWSFVRHVRDGVSVGQLNARSQENSIGLGGTWHMLNSPFSIHSNIPFISIGVRTGYNKLSTPSNGEEANYSMLSFPTVAAGIKYNFSSGIGLRLAASMEKLLLEQTQSNRTAPELPQKEEILEARINIGVSKLY